MNALVHTCTLFKIYFWTPISLWWKICTHALYLYWVFIWLILLFGFFIIFAFCTYFLLLFCTLKRWNEPFKFSQLDQSGPKFTQSGKWRRWRTHWPQLGLYGNRQAFCCSSTNSFTKRFLCLHWRQWRWFRCFSFSLTFMFVFVSLALLVICLLFCFCLQTFFFPSRRSNEVMGYILYRLLFSEHFSAKSHADV